MAKFVNNVGKRHGKGHTRIANGNGLWLHVSKIVLADSGHCERHDWPYGSENERVEDDWAFMRLPLLDR